MKKLSLFKLLLISLMFISYLPSIQADDVIASWPLTQGTANATSAEVSVDKIISSSSLEFGSNLKYASTSTQLVGGILFSQIQPIVSTGNAKAPTEGDYVKFSVTPKKGIKFTPTRISFNASKLGTSGGTIDLQYNIGSGDKATLATTLNPTRNNLTPAYTHYSYDITGVEASEDVFNLYVGIYNLANTKALALDSVKIYGTYSGTAVEVPAYTLTTSMSDAAAGSVTASPIADKYDNGTTIKLTANENFGYHFAGWKDAQDNIVSTDNPYSFAIASNTTLQATYTKKNVYALNLSLTNGARENLVTITPAGNIVNGVHHYEEGTDVKLTAVNNKILTFTNWEDNTTSIERNLTMDGDKTVTANFSACDYIVAWDLYKDDPTSQRAADYASDTENSGLLSLRNADGVTTSWLSLGASKGAQNGKYGIRIWKPLTDKDYFEISFSTKGYKNVKVAAALGDDYNSYSVFNMEYSIDGTTYTSVGSYSLPNRGWNAQEFTLPAEAAGQDKVRVRFMPDYTSALTGVTSTNDGASLAEIFVTADKDAVDDKTAAKLVSCIPANNATGASATGSIVLTFDEKLVAGTGKATLDGENLTGTFSGKTVVFGYSGLKYDTEYTFTLPSGLILDASGNAYEGCSISFTTMQRTQPAVHLYDGVVAQDGTGDYTTVQAAINAAPANRTTPYLIFIKAGTYKEHVDIPATKPYIHLIGQGADKVFISDNKLCGGDNALSVYVGATVVDNAANGYFEGISFVNSWGKDQSAGPQALALYTVNDRVVLNKCGLYSYQDTYLTTTTCNYRHYVKDCFIEGAVDFIYGQGNVYFDNCTMNIVRTSGGYIVAPNHAAETTWGYVFMNCTITAPGVPSETSVWLGRPWHDNPKTVYINTIAKVTIPADGWYQTMGGIPSIWADYNTMDANGNPLDLSSRNKYYYYTDANGKKVEGYAKNHLTDEEAASYTVKNVLSGSDSWQPSTLTEACAAPQVTVSDSKLTWSAVPYAICYVITKGDKVVGFTTDTSYDYDGTSTYQIQAVDEYGGLSAAAQSGTTGISNIQGKTQVQSIYTIDGKKQQSMQKGINIVKYLDINGKVLVNKVCK